MSTFEIILVVDLGCSVLAAAMAYLITLDEYSHHFAEKGKAIRAGLEAAVVTFLVFVAFSVILGLLFYWIV